MQVSSVGTAASGEYYRVEASPLPGTHGAGYNHTNMVLISIQPFVFKKIFVLVATLLCLSSAICVADSLYMSLHSTSYRRQLNRIQPAPPSISERTVQPALVVASQSGDGGLWQNSGGIFPTTLVLDPTIDWLASRSEEIRDL